jgi:hypothetical protein
MGLTRAQEEAEMRARNLRAFLAMTAAARARGEPWAKWIDDGCPELTREQYQASQPQRARGRRRAPSGASA